MVKKKGITVTLCLIGIILVGAFLAISRKEIINYKNIGVNVTNDEKIMIEIQKLAEKFVTLNFSKEPVKCEEIICNEKVAELYNSIFNSVVEHNLHKDLDNIEVDINRVVKENDGEYKVNFRSEFTISYISDGNHGGGIDEYTAYMVEKDGKFYIDRIIHDVDLMEFKNEKSSLEKLITTEEELYNQAIDFEIMAREHYDEYIKNKEKE